MNESEQILELYRQRMEIEVEKYINLRMLRKRLPRRFNINRRIKKKFYKRFGSPYYYYKKHFRDFNDLKPFERKEPILLEIRANAKTAEIDTTPLPVWTDLPTAEGPKIQIKRYTFPPVGWNLKLSFDKVARLSEIDLESIFFAQVEQLILQGTKVETY